MKGPVHTREITKPDLRRARRCLAKNHTVYIRVERVATPRDTTVGNRERNDNLSTPASKKSRFHVDRCNSRNMKV